MRLAKACRFVSDLAALFHIKTPESDSATAFVAVLSIRMIISAALKRAPAQEREENDKKKARKKERGRERMSGRTEYLFVVQR